MLRLDAENKLSRSQIAVELHRLTGSKFSRNAIIGKLARLGVPPKAKAATTFKQKRKFADRPAKPPPLLKAAPLPAAVAYQDSLRLSLNDLTETTCHYPTEGITEFCGHPVTCRSYCAAHYRICYYAPREVRPDQAHRTRVINARKFRASILKPACEAA